MKHKMYNRLLSLALAVGLVIGMLPSAAAVDTVGDAGQPVTLGNSDSGLELSKKLVKNADGTYSIQLEAYATGEIDVSTEYKAVPTDIVLVLDQSGSMAESFQTSSTSGYQKLNISENSEAYSNRDNLYYFNGQNYVKVSVSRDLTWDGFRYTYSWNGQTATSYGRNESIPSPLKGNLYRYTTTTTTTKKQQALKDAVTEFVNSVQAQAQEDNVDHRISIVGFASDDTGGLNYNNTELLSTNNVVNYQYARDQNYQDSLVSVNSNGSVNSRLTTAINRIAADGGTAIDLGMKMAEKVLDNNPVSSDEERNQVVIVFTDGVPGIYSYTNHWDDTQYDATRTQYANRAISYASSLKNSGVSVYSIGIFDGADAAEEFSTYYGTDWDDSRRVNRFMHYLSSNYPQATSMTSGGTPNEKQGFYLSAADADTLKDIFQKISDDIQTGGSSSTLDSNAIVRDVLTKELQLPEGTTANDITLETYKAANGNTVTNPDAAGAWIKDSVNGITASIGADGRTIDVTGFDFSRNFVADTGRLEGNVSQTGDFYGRKLVITIPVEPNPDFFGGNNIDTNAAGSGVYVNAEETTPVDTFVSPNMNIPVNCNVTGNDQTIYITQSADVAEMVNLSAEPNGWNNAYVTITYRVTDSEGNEIGTYTIQPGATTGTWSGDSVSPEDCKDYTVTCTVTPNNGTYDSVNNAPVNAKSQDVNAKVHVLVPKVSVNDTTINLGETANFSNNYTTPVEEGQWVDIGNHVEDVPGATQMAPQVDLSYEFVAGSNPSGSLSYQPTQDSDFNIVVKIGQTRLANGQYTLSKNETDHQEDCIKNDSEAPHDFTIHVLQNYGGVVITKNVIGLENDVAAMNRLKDSIKFTVEDEYGKVVAELSKDDWKGGTWSGSTFNATLRLPVGKYTVTESGYEVENYIWTPLQTEYSFTVEKDQNASVSFTNTYTRDTGSLTIKKTVEGLDDAALDELKNKLTFTVTGPDGYSEEIAFNATGWEQDGNTYTYTLKNVPTGSCAVTEKTGTYEDLINYTWTSGTTTSTVTVSKGATATAALTNVYIGKDGTLNINKVVTKFADDGKPVFDFKLTAADGTVYYFHVDMTGTNADVSKEVVKDFALPVGEYTIEELSNQNYKLSGVTGATNNNDGTYTVRVGSDGAATVTFTNVGENTNIPTDGGATENRVDKIEGSVIVWKKEVYGTDHPEPQPSPNPNDKE